MHLLEQFFEPLLLRHFSAFALELMRTDLGPTNIIPFFMVIVLTRVCQIKHSFEFHLLANVNTRGGVVVNDILA
jgi:hypothetical protein